ncbi:GIY-YIG nuclease family protein [Novosphingobium sp.]|jgi:hypothetical protein|uniref:GIY-YIG nuclease family protein n=1 Tax=Novosphingobium sp. TaxID=1874826 RepID=UPI001EB2AE2E|nr:GIY-YIG nuclease family protein [Novosphingobium sp.]MBK6800091.1 GIY-YIG nuclease family protein [Novosphingobium sp.]MBK9010893.1 GIY-YIG nuclease family protein [Novosphingobium sp.]
MNHDERKAAVAAYRQRKVESGVYVIRCTASAQVWVGGVPDLATIRNRHWFTLRHGTHPNAALQAAWTTHGADSFTFEIAERIAEDAPGLARGRLLKELLEAWARRLDAARL